MAADKKKELFVEATQLIKAGKYGQASKSLKELIALEPSKLEYRRLSASLNLKLGNLISAKAVYDSLVREAMQMKDYRLAESLLREYLAAGPRYIPFLELLGQTCEENGNGLVAANEYGKALQILLEDADPDEAGHAGDLYGKIRQLSPNNPALTQYDPTKFSRAPQPAAPSPLEMSLKMKAAAAPPPPAPAAPPPLAAAPPPMAPPPAPAAPVSKKPAKRARLLDDAPMVDDDLSDVLTPKERPKPKPAPPPAARPQPPMVDDDLTDLLSRPIPKVTTIPKIQAPPPPPPPPAEEKPSLAKTLFGFLQSSPAPAPVAEAPPAAPPPAEAPPAEVPPSPPPAAPVEAAPAAPPQWQPWQAEPEEAPAPVAEAPPADVPAAEPQATDWKPWQPGDSTAPPAQQDEPVAASAAYAAAQPADKGGFFVVDSQTGRGGPAPSLGTAMPQIPTRGRAPAPPMPRRAVGRRAGGLGQVVRKLTTAAVGLAIATGLLLAALVIGCLVLEKSPTDAFRNFSGASPPSAQDPRRNAYVLLLGFDADAGRDPMAEGYERVQGPVSAKSIQCTWEGTASPMRFPSETAAVETWWLGPDPVGQFQKEAAKIQGWTAGSPVLMGRYRQWLGMEFEDGGYGKFAVPNCSLIVAAHRLHVAEGFGQGLARGIDGLERDLTLWRTALAQARTLPVKQLALAVVNDDLTLLTGVFSRPEITPDTVSRLAQLTKPLEQVERSLRWPMQNALTMDAKLFGTSALFDAVGDPSPLLQVLAHLPLPKQRALNAYADYYEALNKAADQPLTKLPLIYEFARTPAKTVFDYATNPLDNLVSSRTVIAWDQQVGAVMDTEARLRLVGVTAFLRGIPRKAIPVRIAQAGPRYTDPYTELPMLLNTSRGLIYSVGRNRKDDDGDSKLDVSVPWPMNEPPREAPKGRAR